MGYKRCLEENEVQNLVVNKAKRFEYNTDIDNPNPALVKPVISGEDEDGFYNIQWYDALEMDTVTEVPHGGDKDVRTIGRFGSSSTEDDYESGATSLSSVSSDSVEFNCQWKTFIPLDNDYSGFDRSPRRLVPVGPNHQATIPVWRGRVNKISGFTGANNDESLPSGPISVNTVDESKVKLMGTSVISMPDSSFLSRESNKGGEGRIECKCLDEDSIRCVRQHVGEARENLRKILGNDIFVNLGFSDMGEEVALQWSEEEEDVFHEIVYTNPASLGRNFWKQLTAAFPSRTKKEIVSYFFNVFMLQRRAAQNRSRILDIDSDDDECHTRNTRFYGFEVSEEDDSAIESLDGQDFRVENQDNYTEDDGDDENSDDCTNSDDFGSAGYDMGNTTEEEGGINQRSLASMGDSQIGGFSDPVQHVDGTPGIPKGGFSVQDDSCMSFEFQTTMNESCSLVHGRTAFESGEFKCDQTPRMPGKLNLCSDILENDYLLEPCDNKDWYPDYSTGSATEIDFLQTSNLIEEFFGQGTPDKKTRND